MSDQLSYAQIQEYLTSLVPPRPAEMREMEAYARQTGFPIIGPAAGYACYQLARLIGARKVFEMGSGYGYSTAWFAKAVQENGGGMVHHVVWDADLSRKARLYLSRLGFNDMIEYHVGEAVQTLQEMPGPFDLIFNDIDKLAYASSLPVIHAKLRLGGLLIVDNVLWSGRIFNDNDQSASTEAIRQLTGLLTRSTGWITTLLPVRDGLAVAYKVT